jgi:hypothetical protein
LEPQIGEHDAAGRYGRRDAGNTERRETLHPEVGPFQLAQQDDDDESRNDVFEEGDDGVGFRKNPDAPVVEEEEDEDKG